jgi:replicative DNA helicase
MTEKQFDPRTAIYYPDEAAVYAVQAVENVRNNKSIGIPCAIPGMDQYFAPLLPGQTCAVIAQTSQYKSGFLRHWERNIAQNLMIEKRKGVGVFHVSVEEGVEEQVFQELANRMGQDAGSIARGDVQDFTQLVKHATMIGNVPIVRIGDSLARAEDMPYLTISNMVRAIEMISKGVPGYPAIQPAAIFFDYLQAFPFDSEIRKMGAGDQQRRLQVRDDTFRLKQAAAYFKCPVVVAVQAKQKMDGSPAGTNLPGIYDGEESSSIAQRFDRIITLWLLARTRMPGEWIDIAGVRFKVDGDMLFAQVAKQRGGLPAGRIFPCRVDFVRNIIRHDPAILGGKNV